MHHVKQHVNLITPATAWLLYGADARRGYRELMIFSPNPFIYKVTHSLGVTGGSRASALQHTSLLHQSSSSWCATPSIPEDRQATCDAAASTSAHLQARVL